LYDRLLGTVALVSLAAPGVAGGGFGPELSLDGGTVVYFIDNPDQPRGSQIVAYDVPSGSRSLVTRAPESPFTYADKGAFSLSLSADGRIVAFASGTTNLVTGQQDANNGGADLFVHDRVSGVTVLASHAAGSPSRSGNRDSFLPAVSADGSWVVYGSNASDLVAGLRDPGLTPDLFLYERATKVNRAVSLHPPGEASRTTAGHSGAPSVSADGRYVAFASSAALIPGLVVPPGRSNIYLHDRVTRRTVLVSRSNAAPLAGGNDHSLAPRVSRDGSAVAFISRAGDLAPGQQDRGGTFDVFLWDRRTGRTTLVSHAHGFPNRAGTGQSLLQDLSADGNIVVFNSTAPGLAPRQREVNGEEDIFVWDRRTNATALVSHDAARPSRTGNAASFFSSISPDGGFIAFSSLSSNLVAGDRNGRNDAFVYERRTGAVSRLSGASGAHRISIPLISTGGRWAAFISGDDRQVLDQRVVLADRATGDTREIIPSTHRVFSLPGLSDDGRWLLFVSDAPDLVPGQRDGALTEDLFLFDRVTREIRLVSHVPGEPLQAGESGAFKGRLSPNGRWVAFESESLLPTDPRGITNVFLYDRTTEEVILASRSLFDPPQGGNWRSFDPVVIDSGRVAFASQASDLVPGDFNFLDTDVFVYVPEE
ncbi:MAG TPA: hypothetical protein VLE27_03305, partial [Thermoanaerobaculia bacterium]|nr:hypothetical protein [Thermoanaerobaculia bacterium]